MEPANWAQFWGQLSVWNDILNSPLAWWVYFQIFPTILLNIYATRERSILKTAALVAGWYVSFGLFYVATSHGLINIVTVTIGLTALTCWICMLKRLIGYIGKYKESLERDIFEYITLVCGTLTIVVPFTLTFSL